MIICKHGWPVYSWHWPSYQPKQFTRIASIYTIKQRRTNHGSTIYSTDRKPPTSLPHLQRYTTGLTLFLHAAGASSSKSEYHPSHRSVFLVAAQDQSLFITFRTTVTRFDRSLSARNHRCSNPGVNWLAKSVRCEVDTGQSVQTAGNMASSRTMQMCSNTGHRSTWKNGDLGSTSRSTWNNGDLGSTEVSQPRVAVSDSPLPSCFFKTSAAFNFSLVSENQKKT